MKFSDFAKNKTYERNEMSKSESNQNIENLYEKYKDYSQAELMEELAKQVAKQKKDGSFDFEKIMNSVNTILPYLNQEQKENILNLLSSIKN